jgi:hypothetical protein
MKFDEDLDIEPIGEETPRILDDIYSVSYVRHEKKFLFGSEKLFIWFKIVTPGASFGVELYKAYNYSKKISIKSLLVKDAKTILGRRLEKREKPTTAIFKNKILRIRTRTVTKDCRQKELAEYHKYSVISEILGVEVGTNE